MKVASLENLMELWSEDAKINMTEPAKELVRIPNLHSKYLNIMTTHKMIMKKYEREYNEKRKIKWEYYNGDLNNPEDLKKHNLPPMQKRVYKQDIVTYLDSDEELNNILIKKMMQEEIVSYSLAVIKELNNRTWQLRSIIDWIKYTSGG
jgi:predicted membrane protein